MRKNGRYYAGVPLNSNIAKEEEKDSNSGPKSMKIDYFHRKSIANDGLDLMSEDDIEYTEGKKAIKMCLDP